MAKKTTAAKTPAKKAAPAKDAKKEVKETGKKKMTPEERKAKAQARKEKMAALPAEQRENSKSIDVIKGTDGSKVVVYAQTIRKFGVIITPVAFDAEGNIINVGGTVTLAGYKPKSKKGHGNLVAGVPGLGKGKAEEEDTEEDED